MSTQTTPYSPEGRHGTQTAYTYGCRCDECALCNRMYMQAYRLKRGETVWFFRVHHWKPKPHGMSGTPTYNSWCSMRDRCQNPKADRYHRYGGRGITVCARWDPKQGGSFGNFLADMGERPEGMTIDRINNDGPYEPSNCRWSTPAAQRANQTASQTVDYAR